jgi:hypothetical protein
MRKSTAICSAMGVQSGIAAPNAVYVPRKGEVNAWDNEDFVKTVHATNRKTLITRQTSTRK